MILLGSAQLLWAQTNETGSFEVDNRTRDYRVHLPPNYDSSNSYPLVINMHGLGSNAFEQEIYSDFNRVSDANNFIVCYPNGVDNAWNSGFGTDVDDVKFLDQLIDTLDAAYNVDLARVYSTGMSNGGFMSYKLACELSDRIAAIASVTGSMVIGELDNCFPSRVIPIMQIHGTNDATVAYEGNAFLVGIEDLVGSWAARNDCEVVATITELEDINTTDSSTVQLWTYEGCENEPRVVFYRVDNGGHTWPGSPIPIGGLVTNQDFDASDEVWAFFTRFVNELALSDESFTAPTAVEVYPNPTEGSLSIRTTASVHRVEVIGLDGQLLHITNDTTIDMGNLDAGMYLLRIQTAEGIAVQKVVKQ